MESPSMIDFFLHYAFFLNSFPALVVTTNQSFNWFEANNACVNKGGRLAYPNELHPSTCANRSIKVWLGKYNQERLTPWLAKQGNVLV